MPVSHCHGGYITTHRAPFPGWQSTSSPSSSSVCGVVVIGKIASRKKIRFRHLVMCSLWQSGRVPLFFVPGKKREESNVQFSVEFRLCLGVPKCNNRPRWGILPGREPLWPTSHLSTDGLTVFLSGYVLIDQLGVVTNNWKATLLEVSGHYGKGECRK